jgi:hypothetical protein
MAALCRLLAPDALFAGAVVTVMATDQIEVVVRFHDIKQIADLERCVFSLVGQDYRPLHVILAVQRFSEADIALTRSTLMPLFEWDHAPSFEILNWQHEAPVDARSALINLGIRSAKGRYLAFLDHDQVLYPEAYRLLISQLQSSGSDIAFAGICRIELEAFSSFHHARATLPSPECTGLGDLFRSNVCPVHSFVIDRTRIPEQFLFFEPFLVVEDAYDFLVRICAQFRSDFTLAEAGVGECYDKVGGRPAGPVRREREAAFVEQRRCNTPLSEAVQRALGIAKPQAELSIRGYLDGVIDRTSRVSEPESG